MILGCSNESDEFAVICESQVYTSFYTFSPDQVTVKSFTKKSREELEEESGMDTSTFDLFMAITNQYEIYEYTPGYISFGMSNENLETKYILNRSSLTLTQRQEMKGSFGRLNDSAPKPKPTSYTIQCSSPKV